MSGCGKLLFIKELLTKVSTTPSKMAQVEPTRQKFGEKRGPMQETWIKGLASQSDARFCLKLRVLCERNTNGIT